MQQEDNYLRPKSVKISEKKRNQGDISDDDDNEVSPNNI